MTLFLQDKSGDIEAKLWTVSKEDMQILKPETIVWVKGDVINYRGRKQMKVNQFRLAKPEDGFKTQDFVLVHLYLRMKSKKIFHTIY